MWLPSTWLGAWAYLIDQAAVLVEDVADTARRWGL
jgi:hypothetical protein